jgi:hypothetical protein
MPSLDNRNARSSGIDSPVVLEHDLDRHAGVGVLREVGVENAVGYQVGDFVGVALGHPFGREEAERSVEVWRRRASAVVPTPIKIVGDCSKETG